MTDTVANWGAKDIAEAAVVLGSSKVATGIMVLIALFIVGRYYVGPWLSGRKKGAE